MDTHASTSDVDAISVVMPVYNEEDTLETSIRGITKVLENFREAELIVIESNSTDSSRRILESLQKSWNSKIILKTLWESHPRGKGFAVRLGLAVVSHEVVAIFDADDEYSPSDLLLLTAELKKGESSFILGSRHAKGEPMRLFEGDKIRSAIYNFGHIFFCTLFNMMYQTKLRDPFTMWKVFRFSVIKDVPFKANRFDFDWELVAKSRRTGAIPIEVPVYYKSRSFEQGKKIRTIRDPLTWLWALVRFRFDKIQNPRII